MNQLHFDTSASDQVILERISASQRRHALALALEHPSYETLMGRLAYVEAIREQLHALMLEAVRQKVDADRLNDIALYLLQQAPKAIASQRGKASAISRYANDPKQDAKRIVRECWENWQANLDLYKSSAEFARDMMEKFGVDVGGSLQSLSTITNKWIPEFRKAAKKS